MQVEARTAQAGTRIADHATPFVFNCWYIAALGSEVGRDLRQRWLLGRDVLLFRRQDGTPAAIQNRCPHRSAPLSMGRLVGDTVVCGYHGFTFDASGTCIRVPSQERVPRNLRIQSYPAVERGPFIWVWMGDAERADPASIPAQDWLTDARFDHVEGYFHVGCNYLSLHENVLDLTHVPFLHGEHNATLQFAEQPADVSVEGNTVTVSRNEYDRAPPPHYAASIGRSDIRVNRLSVSQFLSPAFHGAQTIVELREPSPGERDRYLFKIIHAFTPESATSTHYFWSNARDSSVGDPEVSEIIRRRSTKVYSEDVEILEAAERIRQGESRSDFREVSVMADGPAMQARRITARLVSAELE
ncbi:Rieske 2Fe-2S domain-containing protein [Roseomonas sp. BN140053]|uniref:Rieske 2Fe-2S domain-containing protein n=1 Tax=Roseomonas sp. BN140053 TaxID=3391898 RepID=UPI0039E85EBD